MPGYIGFRPQFNPISLQDYLAVPTMIMSEYAKAENAYNETANKAEALKALLGERNPENEAGWKIVDNYERQLGDLADNIAKGIQGPESYRAAKNSQRYYRESMLPLESGIPAYQKELEKYLADPSMVGAKPALENYIKNPLYKSYMLSGDKIYADMVNQGKMAAADRSINESKKSNLPGYFSLVQRVGYSPEEQQEYLGLVQAALNGQLYVIRDENGNSRTVNASDYLNGNNKYSQLYKGLNSYMKDHAFDQLDENDRLNALERAVSGQLFGMTGTSKEELKEDKIWASNDAFNRWKRQYNYAHKSTEQSKQDSPVKSLPSELNSNDKVKKFGEKLNHYQKNPKDIVTYLPTREQYYKDNLSKEKYNLYLKAKSSKPGTKQVALLSEFGYDKEVQNVEKNYRQLEKKYNETQQFLRDFEEIQKDEPALQGRTEYFKAVDSKGQLNTFSTYKKFPNLLIREKIQNEKGYKSIINPETYKTLSDYINYYSAERSSGLTFNATEALDKQILETLFEYSPIVGDGENKYIVDEDGDRVSNEDLRKVFKDNKEYNIEFKDNVLKLKVADNTYTLKPGAFGDKDKEIRDELSKLYNDKTYAHNYREMFGLTYSDMAHMYMEMIADEARSKAKGQSQTDSKIDEGLLDYGTE